MKKDVLILIPAFNEEASIGTVMEELLAANVKDFADILVVNDASEDKTGYISKKYGVAVVSHVFNLGYGSALQLGYKYAVRHDYQYVIQLDADGQHNVSNIFFIYKRLRQKNSQGELPDIVLGSRFLPGSVSFDVTGLKKRAIEFFRWVIWHTTGQKITDPTSGLQGLNRQTFLYYSMFQNFNNVFPDANMLIQMILLGYKVVEIPAIMHERDAGTSMHAGIWRPVFYMLIMPLSILAVYLRIKTGIQKHKTLELYEQVENKNLGME